jgi:hypothetical protein
VDQHLCSGWLNNAAKRRKDSALMRKSRWTEKACHFRSAGRISTSAAAKFGEEFVSGSTRNEVKTAITDQEKSWN